MLMVDESPMVDESIEIAAPVSRVFDALGDARTYPHWLVGAKRIRRVDDEWPSQDSSFHHTVGAGPVTVKDRTTVVEYERPHLLRLRAGVGPLGSAFVRFVLEDLGAHRTRVVFSEEPEGGVLRFAWGTVGRPLMRLGIWGRNAVSLANLKQYVEEGGAASPHDAAGGSSAD